MKLNVTPRAAVDAETTRFYKDIAQQVNALSEGRLQAFYTALTAIPTTGTWAKGDFILNSNPSELGTAGSKYFVHGWRCTVAGTPGTWVDCKFLTDGTPVASGSGRELLTAARTYYVATTGSDSNNGLTVGAPFLTIQKAVDVTCSIDMSIYQVTIQVANGTYTGATTLKQFLGALPPLILGDTTTPANVIVSTTSATGFACSVQARWLVQGMKVQTTTTGSCFATSNGGSIALQKIDYGSCASFHNICNLGGVIAMTGNYTISGGAQYHVLATEGGSFSGGSGIVTLTGTPAFSGAFALVRGPSLYNCSLNVFSGAATGVRYSATLNGVIYNLGTVTLPGSVAGSVATGGVIG